MKSLAIALFFFLLSLTHITMGQEYKVITIVESIVPAGLGRSRIINATEQADYKKSTTTRTDGKKSKQKQISRKQLRINQFEETKLLNFFSAGGINFQNIASNDAIITSKINTLIKEGWELKFVNAGVESYGGGGDTDGIYITRFYFYKPN